MSRVAQAEHRGHQRQRNQRRQAMPPGDCHAGAREIGDQRAVAQRPGVAGKLRARVAHVGADVGHHDRPDQGDPGQRRYPDGTERVAAGVIGVVSTARA